MKLSKSLFALALCGMMFVSCKNEVKTETPEGTPVDTTAVDTSKVTAENLETASFKIDGMTCAMGCAKTIEKKLASLNGVQKATVDFETKSANVEFDAAKQTPETIRETVEAVAGGDTYKVTEMRSSGEKAMVDKEKEKKKNKKAGKKSTDKAASCHETKGAEAKGGCCAGKKSCASEDKKPTTT
ncbi:heavy-metal-associated domain-containing protein [Flavobacterium sp. NST-5]|uniref:Heavy-metal-associated domain-containing protein n=1 Tax=Flavobacterium ichthyis TaxID=2698827 RepID=A0ABW9Z8U1_9FLAO|nr:heavy-metal-associated domain-containing protein [Flavobacterium ichthyis]NBL63762.1 heavy-metal-associated domain-containing protein [Flavobacterium ichthyis]